MDPLTILAAAAESTAQAEPVATDNLVPMAIIWSHITSLGLLEALTFMSFGAVCLLYGWRVFKVLVVISFAVLGLFLGLIINDELGVTGNPLLPILAGITLAAVSIPLMHWAVGILGAAAGGIATAGAWYACQFPEQYIWAGALVGVVAGGLISFIVFKISVMLFSSLGGSGLLIAGILALFFHYPNTTDQVQNFFFNVPWFLPSVLMAPTAVGVYFQNKFVNDSQNWTV